MKFFFTLLTVVFLASFSFTQCGNIFFSEYIEGSSNNKAVEVYNPTSSVINLGNYTFYRNNNGSITPTDSLTINKMLNPGEVYVIGDPSANAAILAQADTTHTFTFYNGDDAIFIWDKILRDTIDVVGLIGSDPGTNWVVSTGATSNFTLVRKMSVNQGTKDWTIGATQWDVYTQDMSDSLGAHNMNPCGSTGVNTQELSLSIDAFPNPTNGELTINLNETYNKVSVLVCNSLGQNVNAQVFTNTTKLTLDIEGENGFYFVNVAIENGASTSLKVIKE